MSHDSLCGCGGCPGLGARWAVPTNYDTVAHRRYVASRHFGEVQLGDSGWTLGDLASLGLIVLAGIAVWKEMKR